MQIETIHSFLVLSEEGNMHRSCEKLNISQQGLSHQIRSMEQELGATLFVRSHKGMMLTKEGARIRPWLIHTYESYQHAQMELKNLKKNHAVTLKLAICPGVRETIGMEFFFNFMNQYPDILLDLDFETDAKSEELLLNDKVDAAFLDWPEHEDSYDSYTVIYSPLRMVMRKDHPLAKKSNLSFFDIAGEHCYFPDDSDYMTRQFLTQNPDLYHSVQKDYSSNDTSYFTNLPDKLGGIALTFECMTQNLPESLVARPVVEEYWLKISYCLKKDRPIAPELKQLSNFIRKNVSV